MGDKIQGILKTNISFLLQKKKEIYDYFGEES